MLLITTVVVRFKSIGAAPIMKNNVFKVTAGNKYATVVTFLRGQLGSKEGDPLVSSLFLVGQRVMIASGFADLGNWKRRSGSWMKQPQS